MTASALLHENGREAETAQSDALLAGVAEAARQLLSVADFEAAVNGALEAIALAANIDRIYIFENHSDPETGEEVATLPYEWTAPNVVKGKDMPDLFPMSYSDFGDWPQKFRQGISVQAIARDLPAPAQDIQTQAEALSLLGVPIMTEGNWWGVIGFDDCTTERIWSAAEISVLETAAASFAGALQRRAQVAELEAYNQTLENRDRILAATAAASNILLTEADFDTAVKAALRILGESVGCDRIAVGQQFDDPTGETLGFIRFLYEWDAADISPQFFETEDPQDFGWQEMGIENWFNASLRGEAFGQTVDDLPEPFRQTQEAVGVQSTHNVPIFVGNQFWGVVGIDHCRKKRLLSETELAVFKTAANGIGNAIERDRTTNARETAEREAIIVRERAARAAELEAANQVLVVRDRWLETTAIAANQLLSSSNVAASMNDVLKIIGENLECDRLSVMHYLPDYEAIRWEPCSSFTNGMRPVSALSSTYPNSTSFQPKVLKTGLLSS